MPILTARAGSLHFGRLPMVTHSQQNASFGAMSVFENHDPESLIGTVVVGRFEIESEQSRSTSSTSYLAIDRQSDTAVNVRLYSAEATAQHGPDLLAEAALVSEISHPHVVRLTSFDRVTINDVERIFIVQERPTGGSYASPVLVEPQYAALNGCTSFTNASLVVRCKT